MGANIPRVPRRACFRKVVSLFAAPSTTKAANVLARASKAALGLVSGLRYANLNGADSKAIPNFVGRPSKSRKLGLLSVPRRDYADSSVFAVTRKHCGPQSNLPQWSACIPRSLFGFALGKHVPASGHQASGVTLGAPGRHGERRAWRANREVFSFFNSLFLCASDTARSAIRNSVCSRKVLGM